MSGNSSPISDPVTPNSPSSIPIQNVVVEIKPPIEIPSTQQQHLLQNPDGIPTKIHTDDTQLISQRPQPRYISSSIPSASTTTVSTVITHSRDNGDISKLPRNFTFICSCVDHSCCRRYVIPIILIISMISLISIVNFGVILTSIELAIPIIERREDNDSYSDYYFSRNRNHPNSDGGMNDSAGIMHGDDFTCLSGNRDVAILRHLFFGAPRHELKLSATLGEGTFWDYAEMLMGVTSTNTIMQWGPGYEGYDATRSLPDNIISRFGHIRHFHIIHVSAAYSDGTDAEFFELTRSGVVVFLHALSVYPVDHTTSAISRFHASATYSPYPNELLRRRLATLVPGIHHFVHIPFHIDPAMFNSQFSPEYVHTNRDLDLAFLDRSMSDQHPMSRVWSRIVKRIVDDRRLKVRVITGDTVPTEELLDSLNSARALLTDSGIWRQSDRTYTMAVESGALIISDLPLERMSMWQDISITVNPPKNFVNTEPAYEQELLDKVITWSTSDPSIGNPYARESKVNLARQTMVQQFSPIHLEHMFRYMYIDITCSRIQRNYWFPYEFYDRNNHYMSPQRIDVSERWKSAQKMPLRDSLW